MSALKDMAGSYYTGPRMLGKLILRQCAENLGDLLCCSAGGIKGVTGLAVRGYYYDKDTISPVKCDDMETHVRVSCKLQRISK